MSLLFMDSFDHYGTASNPATLGKWGSGTSSPDASSTVVRTGTHALRINGVSNITTKPMTFFNSSFIVGFAFNSVLGTIINNDILRIQEGSTIQLAVAIDTTGKLSVKRGATVLATGTKVLSANNWYYIEFKGLIHGSNGNYELRIDTVPELSASSINTINSGTTLDRVYLSGALGGGSYSYIDDVYIADTYGSAPRNNFLGPVKIECLMPQTDAVAVGSNQGLTPSTGTDHGALVDEIPPNTTDYNGSATIGTLDTYNYPNMVLSGSVLGIQTNMYCQKSDAGLRTICPVIRMPSGLEYPRTAISPNTTFSYSTEICEVNLDTFGEWTPAVINGIQVGMKVVS